MNNEFNGNTRTLIVSFVIAIMFLIPLRFIEYGQQLEEISKNQVLGESVVINSNYETKPVIEAPYNEIENKICIEKQEADLVIDDLTNQLSRASDDEQRLDIVRLMNDVIERQCK